jgi:hypothetical protein
MAVSSVLQVGLALLLSFVISTMQSLISQRVGTDHAVHVFLVQRIRRSGFRLFDRVPDLLNESHCGALPLYIHWVLAHCRVGAVFWSERLLNPTVNTLHVALVAMMAALMAHAMDLSDSFVGLAACLFALTPQFYHALSARNFGLSARGTGLALLTAFFLSAYAVEVQLEPVVAWPALIVLSWLVWGFSTFAQQALCILSVLLLLLGRPAPLIGTALGLGLFVALSPHYSLGYLRNTLRFIRAYATELAPIYILARRPSIWGDIVVDIGRRFATQSTSQALRYAYENSVLVVAMLNPISLVCVADAFQGAELRRGFQGFALSLALCGLLAALATSFRKTRFLGEPERYVEVVTPWATLAGAAFLEQKYGLGCLVVLAVLFFCVDLLQLIASRMLVRHLDRTAPSLTEIEHLIEARWGRRARVCSNNEHFTKLLMQHDWQYAYCLAVGQLYCGLTLTQAFSSFPVLKREAVEHIAEELEINTCLLDRHEFESIFDDHPPTLENMSVAYESERFRLIFLQWRSTEGRILTT